MRLPRGSGTDRILHPVTPVIVASGYLGDGLERHVRQLGATAVVPKPFKLAVLLARIREVLTP